MYRPSRATRSTTPTDPALIEGAIDTTLESFATLAQDPWPNIVLDPVSGLALDDQAGPDGFPINYSSTPLLSGNLLVNVLSLPTTTDVSGRVFNLLEPASQYRVDVYSRTDVFYYQGSSAHRRRQHLARSPALLPAQ